MMNDVSPGRIDISDVAHAKATRAQRIASQGLGRETSSNWGRGVAVGGRFWVGARPTIPSRSGPGGRQTDPTWMKPAPTRAANQDSVRRPHPTRGLGQRTSPNWKTRSGDLTQLEDSVGRPHPTGGLGRETSPNWKRPRPTGQIMPPPSSLLSVARPCDAIARILLLQPVPAARSRTRASGGRRCPSANPKVMARPS